MGIVAQVAGPIVSLPIEDNQIVRAGDLLFEIDPRPFQIAVDKAHADLEKTGQNVSALADEVVSAEAQVQEARASLRLAQTQWKRVEPLAKIGALPFQDRDKAQAQLDDARAGLADAQARLTKAQHQLGASGEDNADVRAALAQLEYAELQLSYTRVVAPVNGYVTDLTLSPGSYATYRQPNALHRQHGFVARGRLPEGDAAAKHSNRTAGARLSPRIPEHPLRRSGAGHRLGDRAAGQRRRARARTESRP